MRVIASSDSSHWSRFALAVDAEPAELHLRAALAGAELDPAVGDQVERGDALRDPCRVVDRRRDLDDAVAEPDVCSVRWLAAARNTSGALECEYSSRKWCSTSQT